MTLKATPQILDQLEINDVDLYHDSYLPPTGEDLNLIKLKVRSSKNIPGVTKAVGNAYEGYVECSEDDLGQLVGLFLVERQLGKRNGRSPPRKDFIEKLLLWGETLKQKNQPIHIARSGQSNAFNNARSDTSNKQESKEQQKTDPMDVLARIKRPVPKLKRRRKP